MSIVRISELLGEHGALLKRLRQEHDALRADHQALLLEGKALRRCLGNVGVVRETEFEDELRAYLSENGDLSSDAGPNIADNAECSTAKTIVTPRGCSSGGSSSSSATVCCSGSGGGAAAPRRSPVSSGSSAGETQPLQQVAQQQRSRTGPRRQPSASRHVCEKQRMGRLSRVPSADGRRDPESDVTSSARGRAASNSPSRRPSIGSAGGSGARQRTEPPRDLYDLALPLLQPGSSTEQQSSALAAMERTFKSGIAPHRWQGPGTPLRAAVHAHRIDMARVVLQARANPNESDEKGVGVLHTASFDGQAELCRMLLEFKADANQADRHGQTPLFFSPVRAVCEVLFLHRADVNVMNMKKQSALHLAGRAGLGEVLVWLAGRVSKQVVETRDTHGATAAYYARHAGVQPEILIKTKMVSFDAPPPAAGRSALVDSSPKGHCVDSSSPASTPRPSPMRQRGRGGGAHDADLRWLSGGSFGGCVGGWLPPLPEEEEERQRNQDGWQRSSHSEQFSPLKGSEELANSSELQNVEDMMKEPPTDKPPSQASSPDALELATCETNNTAAPAAKYSAAGAVRAVQSPEVFILSDTDSPTTPSQTAQDVARDLAAERQALLADYAARRIRMQCVEAVRGEAGRQHSAAVRIQAFRRGVVVRRSAKVATTTFATAPPATGSCVCAGAELTTVAVGVSTICEQTAESISRGDLVTWEDEAEKDDDAEERIVDENGRCSKCGGDVDFGSEGEVDVGSSGVEEEDTDVEGDCDGVASDCGSAESTEQGRRTQQHMHYESTSRSWKHQVGVEDGLIAGAGGEYDEGPY